MKYLKQFNEEFKFIDKKIQTNLYIKVIDFLIGKKKKDKPKEYKPKENKTKGKFIRNFFDFSV